MDFTIDKYRELVEAVKQHGEYAFRHDVDARPEFAFRVAQAEYEMSVKATFYFRAMHFTSHADTIRAIAELGHKVGYHYEDLTTCQGDVQMAYKQFVAHLDELRKIVPVETACAHGSPRSPWDSQSIWKQYDIHALGITYEPMLDTDFSQTLYLTDTGRRWDGYRVAVRDKVPGYQEEWERRGLSFHTTDDIIHAISDIHHPIHGCRLLVNTHPQRWMPLGTKWVMELIGQSGKNVIKRLLVAYRK